jgi:hypothetical protein
MLVDHENSEHYSMLNHAFGTFGGHENHVSSRRQALMGSAKHNPHDGFISRVYHTMIEVIEVVAELVFRAEPMIQCGTFMLAQQIV